MARVLFALQSITLIFVVPLFPGFPPSFYVAGLVLMLLVAGLPILLALCIWSPKEILVAFRDSFSYRRLGISSVRTIRVWQVVVEIFPFTGVASLLLACVVIFDSLGSSSSEFLPVLVAFGWIGLGFTLYSILREVVVKLSSTPEGHLGQALPTEFASQYQLTKREIEVAELLLRGMTYREIGDRLFISPATAKSHILHLYQKTGASSKSELGRFIDDHIG